MNKRVARAVLEEYAERVADLSSVLKEKTIDFDANLFDIQLQLLRDPAKRKAAKAGRRGGKSTAAAYAMVKTAYQEQRTNVAYIALSRLSAKKIIWDEIENILKRYKIEYRTNIVEQVFILGNGSTIVVAGASSEREIEKFRGPHYALVIVDECGSPQFLPLLENLVENIISPALIDTDGTLMLMGTPGVVNAGYFYEVTTGKRPSWVTYEWTVKDNPKLPRWSGKSNYSELAEELLAEIREENGWDEETPIYLREYLGQWVEGDDALIYPFTSNNSYKNLPRMDFQFIFGIDFGVVDDATILVGAYSQDSPNLYIVDEFKKSGMAPSDYAATLKVYYERYLPTVVVADAGGMGKAFIQEIEKRFTLPIEAAEKVNKIGFIELLADDFRLGRLKVHDSLTEVKAELYSYMWKDKALKVLPDKEDHLMDSMLYLWRRSMHFIGEITPNNPQRVEQELYERALNEVEQTNGDSWWENA